MISAYIVEDEFLARKELIYLLSQSKIIKIIGEAEDIHHAFWDINEKQPDVVFLDIKLDSGNGIDLAKQLNNMQRKPLVVFVTAYDHYALKAFDLDAIDYLVKPIDIRRLLKTIDKLSNLLFHIINKVNNKENLSSKEQKQSITVKENEKIVIINTEDILYIGTENRQAYIQTVDKKYLTDKLLYKIMEKLGDNFVQVHRGYIVNINQIVGLEPWFNRTYLIILKNGSKISVSRSYVQPIKKIFDL